MVKAFPWAIVKHFGKDKCFHPEYGPGDHWWNLFRQRHPNLTLRASDNLERSRAEALNPAIVSEYFELLNKILESNALMNSPIQICNCDETFFIIRLQ